MLTDYIYSLLDMSDVHVSRTECLTLPEAWIAEVPTVTCYFDEKLSGSIEEAESAQGIGCAGPDIFIEMVDDCITHGNGSGIFHEGREEYIKKWLGKMPGSSRRIAEAIVALLKRKQLKTWKEPSLADYATLHKVLEEHSRANALPKSDWLGQYGKVVTLEQTDKWVRNMRVL